MTTTPRCIIYGLVDPRTMMVWYVGLSSSGLRRPGDHGKTWALRDDRSRKAKWIRELRDQGLNYRVAVLQESSKDELNELERWWIGYGRLSRWPLTNLTDGGEGNQGWIPNGETREKWSAQRRGRVVSPETRAAISAYHKGRPHSLEHNERVAAANRGRRVSDETRARMRESHIGKRQSPELIERRISALRGRKRPRPKPPAFRINLLPPVLPNVRIRVAPRAPVSDATRARMRAAKIGRTQSPESIAKRAAANRGKRRTPEQLAVLSLAQRVRHAGITHCPSGHEYTAANKRLTPTGTIKGCRECGREYYERKKRTLVEVRP